EEPDPPGGSPSPLSGVQASQTAHPLAVGELGFGNVGPAPRLLPPRHWLRGPGAGPSAQPPGWRQAPRAQFPGVGGGEAGASGRRLRGCSGQERPRPLPARSGLCLAFVESRFNISKGNENADGSFQINSHYWCNDDRSHSENICHEDCQGLARAPGWESSTHRTSIPMQGLGMSPEGLPMESRNVFAEQRT
uniref:Uncharacterized protein n=1 Tax=Canis lupus dingo TaxID=286419 RepID=A0A8C0JL19_CANLU